MLATALEEPQEAVQHLLDAGANPNKPGRKLAASDKQGAELVVQVLLEAGTEAAEAAANACVRAGARYNNLGLPVRQRPWHCLPPPLTREPTAIFGRFPGLKHGRCTAFSCRR
eukprot:SAG22_NODE_1564_length_4112_cov_2.178420_3_plen_113_part_00